MGNPPEDLRADLSKRRVFAGEWFSRRVERRADAADHTLPVQFPELWLGGFLGVVPYLGPLPRDHTLFPVEIWELLCATILRVLGPRDPPGALALFDALSRAFSEIPRNEREAIELDLEDVARRLKSLTIDVTPRRKSAYSKWHIRPVVHSLGDELRLRHRRGHGYPKKDDTAAYLESWWRRRAQDDCNTLSVDARKATYPKAEVREALDFGSMPPQALAVFLVAKRYALAEETVRGYLKPPKPL